LTDGELQRRAQSRGEWPGVRRTLRRGLAGMELCVGGRAREDDEAEEEEDGGPRFGRGERGGSVSSPAVPGPGGGCRVGRRGGARAPPDARCAEFAAGKDGTASVSGSVNVGSCVASGVAGCEEVMVMVGGCGFLNKGGGGIDLRSRSSFVTGVGVGMGFDSAAPSLSPL
jgi:hypothetical protein